MTIQEHAIRRYKQRIGKKSTSRKRIIAQINKDLKNDVLYRKKSKVPGCYILVTSKYQAVCDRHFVITILDLVEDATSYNPYQRRDKIDKLLLHV